MAYAWHMHGMCMAFAWYMLLILLLLPGCTGALTTLFATDTSYRHLEPGSDCLQLMGPASSFGSVLKIRTTLTLTPTLTLTLNPNPKP